MKRLNKYAFQQGILKAGIDTSAPQIQLVQDDSELNRLLKIVFAPDDDGHVDGDLSYIMSSKADPQIVNFVKEVLMQDLSNYRQPSIPDGMSDEDFESFQYRLGESKQEYAERISDIIKQSQFEIEKSKSDLEDNE